MTRYLFLADVHADLRAFSDVLLTAKFDRVFGLGDTVGYGEVPNECCALMKYVSEAGVMGNHDHWALMGTGEYVPGQLSEETYSFLASLPRELVIPDERIRIVHADPADPHKFDRFLQTPFGAARSFKVFEERICVVGHTHVPHVFALSPDGELFSGSPLRLVYRSTLRLESGWRYIVNAGSVGQLFGVEGPEASFLIHDTETNVVGDCK